MVAEDLMVASDEYDDCCGAHDISVVSHPLSQTVSSQPAAKSPAAVPASLRQPQRSSDEAASHTDDDHFSELPDTKESEVVFVKDGVSIRPTRSEAIAGRLSLIKQQRMLFLTWLPYSQGCIQEDGTFERQLDSAGRTPISAVDRTAYAVHPLPLSEVQALRKHVPSFGTHHVVVILGNGLTLPPLFFREGGVRAMFSALKEHTLLTKSAEDSNTYVVNDLGDPLQQSLSALELKDVLLGASLHTLSPGGMELASHGVGRSMMEAGGLGGGKLGAWGQLQRVTQLARDTTSSLFAPFPDGPSGPTSFVQHADPALAAAPSPLAVAIRRSAAGGSRAAAAAQQISAEEAATSVGVFEVLDRSAAEGGLARRRRMRLPPLSLDEWGALLGPDGQLADERGFRERVFSSGCSSGLRREAWKFLLGLYSADMSSGQRRAAQEERRAAYERLKSQWTSISDVQAARFAKWRERKSRVDKDVRRTDRAQPFYGGDSNRNIKTLRKILLSYCMYNFDLGYVQGMSDLASPLLFVMRDEAEAFWAFAALMERFESNFHTDCTGMHRQLNALKELVEALDPGLHAFLASRDATNYFFCYRWLLIHLKREFAFDEVLRLWEAFWAAGHVSEHFHIWAVFAVLQQHRRPLMEAATDFDSLLKYCIQISGKLDLEAVLRDAELLAEHSGETGRNIIARLSVAA